MSPTELTKCREEGDVQPRTSLYEETHLLDGATGRRIELYYSGWIKADCLVRHRAHIEFDPHGWRRSDFASSAGTRDQDCDISAGLQLRCVGGGRLGSDVQRGRGGTGLDRQTAAEQVELVRSYLQRREQIEILEDELSQIVAQGSQNSTAAQAEARRELAALHSQQEAERPLVEAILERQVRAELFEAGLDLRGIVWPPVSFTFIEPPLKLTVSPRERIATIHSLVLQTEFDPVTLAEREQAIEERTNLSAHISRIGGMAVYPAIVVEQSSLAWVLSTIAHEWTHHYLFLFPLGLRYATSDELTTINETVSDIIGDEIGERLARRYYPEALPQPRPARGSGR